METTVTLQPPFEYSLWVLVFFGVLLIVGIVLLVLALRKLKSNAPVQEVAQDQPVYNNPGQITLYNAKRKYVSQIQQLLADYSSNKISKRDGYQKLSLIIRGFVHDTTRIDVTKCTLKDLKALKIPKLDTLIEEYYVPEFGEDARSVNNSLEASCNKAMGVIKSWN